MAVDFFLWPMLVPLIIPVAYCMLRKREALVEVVVISITAVIIVALWPVYSGGSLGYSTAAYVSVKVLLFVALPILVLFLLMRRSPSFNLAGFGVKRQGLRQSLLLCLLLLIAMLAVNYLVWLMTRPVGTSDFSYGSVMFFEASTEEFFFRGVLFVLLLSVTRMEIAYATSFASFALMHVQYYMNGLEAGLLATLVQSVLTIEIARRSGNIAGSWILHGASRFFTIAILPLF